MAMIVISGPGPGPEMGPGPGPGIRNRSWLDRNMRKKTNIVAGTLAAASRRQKAKQQ